MLNSMNTDMTKLPMLALDQVPTPTANAKKITGLVKSRGKIAGYQLSDGSVLSREEGVALAKQGGIAGVGIAHRSDTEYLKSLPDGRDGNNLGQLPSISAAAAFGENRG